MQTFVLSSIAFVIVGQLLNACIVLIDKYIVTKTSVSDPKVYAFYVAIISSVVLVLLPFGVVNLPTFNTLALSLIIGFVFIASIVSLYSALKHANATDVVAWLAAVSTLTTFVFSFFFLNEQLPASFAISLLLFLIGMALVGHFRFYARSFLLVVCSGILFGLSAVFIKVLFAQTNFIDGFFWSRMGNVVGALSLLLFPSVRKTLFSVSKSVSNSTSSLIVVNRIIGGVSFLCVLYAIRLGSVSVVNALSSLQFVFIFLLIFLLRNRLPEFYHHEFRPGHILHKILAILFIMAGFITLFI